MLGFAKRIADISYTVPGGLANRGARSDYYRSRFSDLTRLLHFGGIPGHQHFEEMVERRIGPAYGLISQSQLRFARIAASIAEIEEVAQTDREVQLLAEMDAQTKAAEKLLTRAEFGFWFALFPYYSSTFLLHNIFDEEAVKAINISIDNWLNSFGGWI